MCFFYTFISGYSLYFLVFVFISLNSHGYYKNTVWTNYDIHSIIYQNGLMANVSYLSGLTYRNEIQLITNPREIAMNKLPFFFLTKNTSN